MLMIRDTTDRSAALDYLRRAERHSVDNATAEEMADGCHLLDVIEHGRIVGALAVQIVGQRATITGAGGDQGECTYEELSMVEDALVRRGVTHLLLKTKRPGLVRQMARRGYGITECTMEKGLDRGQ